MAFWMAPLAMGALGAYQGHQEQQEHKRHNKAQAEMTKYSPWTGMSGQVNPYTGKGALGGAIGGAASGAALSQAYMNSGNPAVTPNMATDPQSKAMMAGIDLSARDAKPLTMNMPRQGESEWEQLARMYGRA
jgi:hypothetical protein